MNRHLQRAKVLYVGDARNVLCAQSRVWSTALISMCFGGVRRATQQPMARSVASARNCIHLYQHEELARLGKNYGYLRDVNWKCSMRMLSGGCRNDPRNLPRRCFQIERLIMKICHVITRLIVGGRRKTGGYMHRLKRLGHDVDLVTGHKLGRKGRCTTRCARRACR